MLDKDNIDKFYAKLMIANDGVDEPLPFDGSSELSILAKVALVSQFETMMYDHAPSSELVRAKSLPELGLPMLPKHLWRLAQQVLDADELIYQVRALEMMHQRGYVVSPTVWLPPKQMKTEFDDPDGMTFEGELPSVYLAWLAWTNNEQAAALDEPLTADNWDEFYPAERIRLLKNLRRSDPKIALDLIAQFAPNEPAEKRLTIIETLAVNLSDDDRAFLQSLDKDRSQKVKELSKQLLARLGEFDNEDTLADELFDELEMTGDGINFKSTKNNKRRQDNFDRLQKVNLFVLAKKFELSLKDFLLAWDFGVNAKRNGYYDYNRILFQRIIPLLTDDELVQISEALIKLCLKGENRDYWWIFRHRLPIATRQEFAEKIFVRQGFGYTLMTMPSSLEMKFNTLKASNGYKSLMNSIESWLKKNSGYIDNYHVCQEICALGLLVNQDTAKECLVHLEELGIMKTDPVLSVLTLNALLDPLEVSR